MQVELLSPTKALEQGELMEVRAATRGGELGILPGHCDLLSLLVPGRVTLKKKTGAEVRYQVSGGYLYVRDNRVRILAHEAHRIE